MPGCTFEARAGSEDRILAEAASHAKDTHNREATPALAETVKAALGDE